MMLGVQAYANPPPTAARASSHRPLHPLNDRPFHHGTLAVDDSMLNCLEEQSQCARRTAAHCPHPTQGEVTALQSSD